GVGRGCRATPRRPREPPAVGRGGASGCGRADARAHPRSDGGGTPRRGRGSPGGTGLRTLFRATNWLGDVAMSLPALRALRASFPGDHLAVLARSWVADLYRIRPEVDEVIVEDVRGVHAGSAGRDRIAAELSE